MVFQKSVPEPSYSEVSIYPKVASKAVSSVYLTIEFTKKKYIMFYFHNRYKYK